MGTSAPIASPGPAVEPGRPSPPVRRIDPRGTLPELRRVGTLIAFLIGVAAVDRQSRADLVLDSSSVSISFTADTATPGTTYTANGSGVGGLTLDQTATIGAGTATGFANVNTITSNSLVGFEFAFGTGVSRDDPNDDIQGATTLDIHVSGTWTVVGTPFGPPLINFAHFPVLSDNPSAGDVGEFRLSVDYGPGNAGYSVDHVFSQTGVAQDTFDYAAYHNPDPAPVGSTVQINADVFFSFSGHSLGSESFYQPAGSVPEPSSLLLMGTGIAGLVAGRRRLRRCRRDPGAGVATPR